MKPMIFAGNWKMHCGPLQATAFLEEFLTRYHAKPERAVWLFPPDVSLATVANVTRARPDITVGTQNVHWEPSGAFTGETSVDMAREAGAKIVLIGHSERRHVFGETIEETGRKLRAVLQGGLDPVLCVGETLAEREAGETTDVIERQLEILDGLSAPHLERLVVAYEPVWAIGTGRNAQPADAAAVHAHVRVCVKRLGGPTKLPILYGGSVKPGNVAALVAETEVGGVLVGGASLDPADWAAITSVEVD